MSEMVPSPSEGEFLFYATEDGVTRVRLLVDGQTVWMPQAAIAELFDTTKQNIGQHVRNILEENELEELSVVKNYFTTAADGKQYQTKHYNLDMILAIGYRVRSPRGTQFRRWATQTLREYLVKGFVLDDQRLKSAKATFGQDYFDELLERIRDIRASERRFYQKITDIYATSVDYDGKAEVTQEFFATVQNKLEWAITGMTAAEIIKSRVSAAKSNMGLKTWKNAPGGRIRKTDVTVAKNYLDEATTDDTNHAQFFGCFGYGKPATNLGSIGQAMSNSLYVASRSGDREHGNWGPVARLDRVDDGWRFLYLQGAKTLPGFRPFYEFPDLEQIYESDALFPLFTNRLLSKSRPEYEAWLTWGGFNPSDPPDPIALLGVTEGRRVTDAVEVFPCPQPDESGCYVNRFFVHGVRWMPEAAQQSILNLSEGSKLALLPDRFNVSDRNAVALRPLDDSVGRYLIGYIPRYLAAEVCELYDQCDVDFIKVTVTSVNRHAPSQQRLLCQMSACWPDGFRPCATEIFQPIMAEFALQVP